MREFNANRATLAKIQKYSGKKERTPNDNVNPQEEIKKSTKDNHVGKYKIINHYYLFL